MNFIEIVTPAIVMILIGGLEYPVITLYAGAAFFTARLIFTLGYSIKAAYRVPGMMLQMASLTVMISTSVLSLFAMYRKMNSL